MKSIKNHFIFKALIFFLFFFLLKELTYLLIEDYFVVRFRFNNLNQGLYYQIFVFIFVIIQIFFYYLFSNIYKKVKLFWSLFLFILSLITSFYFNSLLFYIFNDEYAYSYLKILSNRLVNNLNNFILAFFKIKY